MGDTILFISHHLEEVLELSDRITVLRKGRKVGTIEAERGHQGRPGADDGRAGSDF